MKTTRKNRLMPKGIPRWIRCYQADNEMDEYTVCYTGKYRKRMEWFQYVGMSAHPFHPQGLGQHGESRKQIDVNKWGFAPMIGRNNHLGTRIPFQALPEDCRKLVIQDYKSIWSI